MERKDNDGMGGKRGGVEGVDEEVELRYLCFAGVSSGIVERGVVYTL